MTIEEVILERQVTLNNNWPEITDVETEARNYVRGRLADKGLKQILTTVKIDKTTAFAALVSDKQLAKIFSSFLDVYDSLPYHPDLAFDAAWRSLEYSIRVYADRAWGYKEDKPLHDIFQKISSEVVESLINKEDDLKDAFEYLVSNTSISAARYTTVRLFYAKQLSVAPQNKFVRERVEKVLSKNMLEAIKKVYMDERGDMDTRNVIDVARRLIRLLNGQGIQIGDTSYKPIPLCDRIELLISGILYTSRCERFHGDIYSPLKSTKTTLLTYYEYYFLTLTSMLFFWVTFYKLIERNGNEQCVKFSNLKESVITTINRMNDILSNKQK